MSYDEIEKRYPSKKFGEVNVKMDYDYNFDENICTPTGWEIYLLHSCDEWVIGNTERAREMAKNLQEAIASGDKEAAQAALVAAQPELMRAATKGVLHGNTASRKVSRLARRVKALSA